MKAEEEFESHGACVHVRALHVAVVREGLSEEVVTSERRPEPSGYLREEHSRC